MELAEKPLDVRSALWTGSMGILGVASQGILLLFLVYFLLASGDLYKRKLVRIVGPSLSRQRTTLEVLDEVSGQIQRFLFVQLLTSAIVALISWLAFRWAGLGQAAAWGVAEEVPAPSWVIMAWQPMEAQGVLGVKAAKAVDIFPGGPKQPCILTWNSSR